MRALRLVSVGILCSLGYPKLAIAQVPDPLQEAEVLAATVDAAERSPEAAADLDRTLDLQLVDAQLSKVNDFLDRNPDHEVALLLRVRLGRVHDMLAYRDALAQAFQKMATKLPEHPPLVPYFEILDRILARNPNSAAGHYWRARLLLDQSNLDAAGASPSKGQPVEPSAEATAAMHHATEAVRCDPENAEYREFLARVLAMSDQIDSAAVTLEHESTAGTRLHLLIRDLIAVGRPPAAESDDLLQNFVMMTGMMGAADSEKPSLTLYPEVRFQAWSTRASLDEVEAYYRERLPGTRFFDASGWEGARGAAYVLSSDQRIPVSDAAEYQSGRFGNREHLQLVILPPSVYGEIVVGALEQGMPVGPRRTESRVGILFINGRY